MNFILKNKLKHVWGVLIAAIAWVAQNRSVSRFPTGLRGYIFAVDEVAQVRLSASFFKLRILIAVEDVEGSKP